MYYIVYTSYAEKKFQEADLQFLLLQSRDNNAKSGITGMLYYFPTTFYQLIEGEESEVKRLYEKITKDVRHRFAVIIKEGYISVRYFPDWTMGYKFLSNKEIATAEIKEESGTVNPPAVLRLFKI